MLKYLDNWVRVIKKAVSSGAVTIFGASVFNKVFSFISGTLVVRFISKGEYGIYSYAYNQLSFFLLATGMGVASGILQVCSEEADHVQRREQVYRYGCLVGVGFNILLCTVIAIYAVFAPLPIEGAGTILLKLCLLPMVMLLPELQNMYLRSTLRNHLYALSSMLSGFMIMICSCVGAYRGKVDGLIIGRYLAFIVVILCVSTFFRTPIRFQGGRKLDKCYKISLLKISFISMLNNGISELLYLFDVFLIGVLIVSDEAVASYKVATTIPTALTFLPVSIVTFIYPYFARKRADKEWTRRNYCKVLCGSFLLDGVIAVVLIVIAPWLLTVLFGQNYLDAVQPFRILTVGFAFSGTFRIISGNLLVAQRELKWNTVVCVVSGLVNVVADIILIRMWGTVGAAIATVIVQLLSGFMNTGRMFYVLRKD